MGRPRLPTKVLTMRGSFEKHPERKKAREGEPEVSRGIGDPPKQLNEAEQARWAEIRDWAPWLTIADRPLLEQTVRLWMLDRSGKATAADSKLFQSNLTRLGMTPADRSRVKVADAPKRESKLAQLLKRPA
jgi:hypothetical protein